MPERTNVEIPELEQAEAWSAEYEAWLDSIDNAREARASSECGE
jgi:hypothetical protein